MDEQMTKYRSYLNDQNLNERTILNHLSNITNYLEKFELERPYYDVGNNIEKTYESLSKRKNICQSVSKYVGFLEHDKGMSYKAFKEILKPIHDYMKNANDAWQQYAEERNRSIGEDPNLAQPKDIKKYLKDLDKSERHLDYVLVHLMWHYQCRNMDMIGAVVDNESFLDNDRNWFVIHNHGVRWIRNSYKTSKTYKQKIINITSKVFKRNIIKLKNVLKPNDNFHRVITNATSGIGGLTESKIAKIYMLYNSSPDDLKKIRASRGTSVDTLVDNYNIKTNDI
jgi:hypothetical protein